MSLIATVCSTAFVMIVLVMGNRHLDGYKLLNVVHSFVIRTDTDSDYRNRCWSRVWSLATADYCCDGQLVLLLLWQEVREGQREMDGWVDSHAQYTNIRSTLL